MATNINLSHADESVKKPAPRSSAAKTTGFSLTLIVVTILLYSGLFFYNSYLSGQIDTKLQSVSGSKAQLKSAESLAVADFSRRAEEIDKHLNRVVIINDSLGKLENTTMNDVTLTTYSYTEGGAISLSAKTNVMKNVAQQIVAYQGEFLNVNTKGVAYDKDGNIIFDITMQDKVAS